MSNNLPYLNSLQTISDDIDKEFINNLIITAEALERCTNNCIYIIDYFKEELIFVSDNIDKVCGKDAQSIKKLGLNFYQKFVPNEEFVMISSADKSLKCLLNSFTINERKNILVMSCFHMQENNCRRLINHKYTPIIFDSSGKIRLALCAISLATGNTPGKIVVKQKGSNEYYLYSHINHKWTKNYEVEITKKERDVLLLSMQGYTMDSIAEIMCKSVDTIKTYKRNLFKKMNVKNIAEALAFAQNHMLI